MPYLTADALQADPHGLEFLRSVLARPSDRRAAASEIPTASKPDEPDLTRPVACPDRAPAPVARPSR